MMFDNKKRIVIKIGSSLLMQGEAVRVKWLDGLMSDVRDLLEKDIEVVIVSSGSIAIGRRFFAGKEKLTIAQKQASAALGQIHLMNQFYGMALKSNFDVAQVLLSASDCDNLKSYSNLQNVFAELLKNKIVPIVNENDSVAIDEIKIGDNDRLAARVAQIISADLLVLFSDIDGLYDCNPKIFPEAKLISEVFEITKEIEEMASNAVSKVGTGGMITKIVAAKMALLGGCETVVTSGLEENCLADLFAGNKNHTIFRGGLELKSRKKRLSGFLDEKGEVVVNDRAKEILLSKKASLLPIGIVKTSGNFRKNDLIFIRDEAGNHVASGIANYGFDDLKKVLLKNGDEVKKILGISRPELIHVDNMVVNNSI